jgi:hypothetical protein
LEDYSCHRRFIGRSMCMESSHRGRTATGLLAVPPNMDRAADADDDATL